MSRPGERWDAVKELFLQVIESPPNERISLLEHASGIDPRAVDEVRRLLTTRDEAVEFFERLQTSIGVSGHPEAEFGPADILNDRFKIVRFIASGGMGQVYEADDLQLGGRLAIKVLRRDIAEWPGALDRFHEEIGLARTINSPHICRVFDVACHRRPSGRPAVFFTMELLDGETLAHKLRRDGPFAIETARATLAEIALGLKSAHAVGVLHCDLKPSNIMLCDDRVVITDFGLSRRSTGADARRDDGLTGGTPAYLAPEQALCEPESIVTDVYSFGIVAYEMVTGQLPFRGNSVWEIARKRIEESPIPPRLARPDLPASWDRAIMRCLRRVPGERYQTVSEFTEAIGCHKVPRLTRRNLLFSTLAVAAVGVPAIIWRSRSLPPRISAGVSIAITPFTGDAKLRYLADGTADRLADSLGSLPGIRVIARAAAERLQARAVKVVEAGSMAGAAYMLSGEVQGISDEIRIHLKLVDAATDLQLWSNTYTVQQDQIESVPPAAIRALVRELKLDLQPAQMTTATATFTESPEAYQLYLLGRYHAAKRNLESMRESVSFLRRSVEIDPHFAAAHAALAYSTFQFGMMDRVSTIQYAAQARDSAARALSLEPDCAEAYLVQALIAHFLDWNWSGAETNYQRALKANPNSVLVRQWYARMLCARRRLGEATQQVNAAMLLDPLDPALRVARGIILTYSGQPQKAIDGLRLLAAEDPGHTNVFNPLSCALEAGGRYAEAIEAADRGVQLTDRKSFMLSQLGHLYALTGDNTRATQILTELLQQYDAGRASPGEVAMVYAGWKDVNQTLHWLETGLQRRELGMLLLAVDPQVDFLRRDPRFQQILAKVHPGL